MDAAFPQKMFTYLNTPIHRTHFEKHVLYRSIARSWPTICPAAGRRMSNLTECIPIKFTSYYLILKLLSSRTPQLQSNTSHIHTCIHCVLYLEVAMNKYPALAYIWYACRFYFIFIFIFFGVDFQKGCIFLHFHFLALFQASENPQKKTWLSTEFQKTDIRKKHKNYAKINGIVVNHPWLDIPWRQEL